MPQFVCKVDTTHNTLTVYDDHDMYLEDASPRNTYGFMCQWTFEYDGGLVAVEYSPYDEPCVYMLEGHGNVQYDFYVNDVVVS